MKREQVEAFWQCLPHSCAIREHTRNGAVQSLRAVVQIATVDRKSHRPPDLRHYNSSELFFRLDQQEMVRRLQRQPLAQTGTHCNKRSAGLERRTNKFRNKAIKR